MGKFYQCIQSYGPSFMTKFCSALYLENLLRNIFAKLNLRGGVSCMPAALLFCYANSTILLHSKSNFQPLAIFSTAWFVADLLGNHIVGFLMRWLIFLS